MFANAGADLVVDVSGWFVGTPGPAPLTAPTNVRPPDCTTSTDPTGLDKFFDNGPALAGADYQRAFALPDGRVLWFFQDVYFRGRNGSAVVRPRRRPRAERGMLHVAARAATTPTPANTCSRT